MFGAAGVKEADAIVDAVFCTVTLELVATLLSTVPSFTLYLQVIASFLSQPLTALQSKVLLAEKKPLFEAGFVVDNSQCLYETNIDASGYKKIISRPQCQVKDYPVELKNTKDWVPKTFLASLDYDYLISKSVEINFNEVVS